MRINGLSSFFAKLARKFCVKKFTTQKLFVPCQTCERDHGFVTSHVHTASQTTSRQAAHESAKKSYSGERSRKLLQKIATLVVCVEKTVFNVLRLHIDCDICYIRVMFGKDKQLCVCVMMKLFDAMPSNGSLV